MSLQMCTGCFLQCSDGVNCEFDLTAKLTLSAGIYSLVLSFLAVAIKFHQKATPNIHVKQQSLIPETDVTGLLVDNSIE
ncbi:hypothetical protein SS50377_20766 [Spironucleus salmonicida]|uniref:Uncharacterized protein n=1 Tax=Spironucleus salmonicida TaxID=348837 RepID=V6LR90_9EUKA|nr:hypothetical protein SS50377_20766 [Spironucleus salmonicida]|eukprot:EST47125.1 Hypothetical protein SS50377_fx072 [Spironucleus salmonicida]